MLEFDFIVDFGPGAGAHGGRFVVLGTTKEIMDNNDSMTGQYLSGKKEVGHVFKRMRKEELTQIDSDYVNGSAIKEKIDGKKIVLKCETVRNLKNENFEIL